MSAITINGNSFDPAENTVRAFGLESVDASQSNYILIQTSRGPLKKEQKEALREKDVEIHEYVSKNTYLCGYKPKNLSTIRDLDFI
jgi:histidinol-phosphate/aromatic aminotransferase/cobyric acid decarboxylase-like protein